jgi:hypothetical protein
MNALRKNLSKKKHTPTPITRRLFASLAATMPQVSPVLLEIMIAYSRFTFLLECGDGLDLGDYLDLGLVSNCSPTRTAIDGYVADLAIEQNMIASEKFCNANKKFFHSDGGQKGQMVKVLTMWDTEDTTMTKDGSVLTYLLDVENSGKKSR